MPALLGKKLGMTQIFDDAGNVVPVTVVEAGPCLVVGVRTPEREGYAAVQLGFGEVAEGKVNKPARGVFARKGFKLHWVIHECRLTQGEQAEVVQSIKAELLSKVDRADGVGRTKDKGVAEARKRH